MSSRIEKTISSPKGLYNYSLYGKKVGPRRRLLEAVCGHMPVVSVFRAVAVSKTPEPKQKIAPTFSHSERFENLSGNGKRHVRDEDIAGQNINPILRMHRESLPRTNSIEGESRLYRRNNVFLCVPCGPPIALKRAERVFPR